MDSNQIKDTNNCLVEEYLSLANDQAKFDHDNAREINKRIPCTLRKDMLVKPLPVEKILVTKEVPVPNGKKDSETGAEEYDLETREESIDAPFVEGIIIALPETSINSEFSSGFVLGEHILYPAKTAMLSYLYKDAVLIAPYNIVGKIKPNMVKAVDLKETIENVKDSIAVEECKSESVDVACDASMLNDKPIGVSFLDMSTTATMQNTNPNYETINMDEDLIFVGEGSTTNNTIKQSKPVYDVNAAYNTEIPETV